MSKRSDGKNKKLLIYFVVALIIALQLINIFLIYKNNQAIERNKSVQENAEKIKVDAANVIRYLHQVDVGLRGYALSGAPQQFDLARKTYAQKDSLLNALETALSGQNFPMEKFYDLEDTMTWYFSIISNMEQLIRNDKMDEFSRVIKEDPGYKAWHDAVEFSRHVNVFEDRIAEKAEAAYQRALKQSYIFQILLLLITAPVLSFTGYYVVRTLNISEALRKAENEKYQLLDRQKEELEREVKERTYEIQAQNEEIQAQNEEIQAHNDQLIAQQEEIENSHKTLKRQHEELINAKNTIEQQNDIIKQKNQELEKEVERQTEELKKANVELIEKNNRLEQFTYIISHNLRSPVARLYGLSDLLPHSPNDQEKQEIIRRMINTTNELNQTLIDLRQILDIQKINTSVLSEIDLNLLTNKIMGILETEIKETDAVIHRELEVKKIYSLQAYVESIFYNLIVNAIKYRHPDRPPSITIKSYDEKGWAVISVTDNGMGIDMAKYKGQLFSLYKRFHLHVEGKGMGLYLVKTQVEALNGKIEIESEEGKGTSFYVYLKNH